MASSNGYIVPLAFLTDQVGGVNLRPTGQYSGDVSVRTPLTAQTVAEIASRAVAGSGAQGTLVTRTPISRSGAVTKSMGEYWFERVHIIPKSRAFGNILATVNATVQIYNAYQSTAQVLTAFTNNAGAGIALSNLPALPYTLPAATGITLNMVVSPVGVPNFNTTLDFTIGGVVLKETVSGARLVVLTYRPELPLVETVEFLTDVLEHVDGSEQRSSLRYYPRHIYEFSLFREYGDEYARLEHLLYEWQHRPFGMPLWHEPSFLTVKAVAGTQTFTVNSTANSSLRVGGLAVIYAGETTNTAVEITAITSTTIQFAAPLDQDYQVGTEILPLRVGLAEQQIAGTRNPIGGGLMKLKITATDNIVTGATAGWSTYSGKVLLDDANAIEATLNETLQRRLVVFDNGIGKVTQASPWARFRRASAKTFVSTDRATLWKVRQLLYSLSGRRTSFYLPTFNKQLIPSRDLTSGSVSLFIDNTGYSRFVQSRAGRNVIRVRFTDGTSVVRTVTTAAESSSLEEQLTLNTTWSRNYTIAEVDSIDYFEKVRFDSDSITLSHADAVGNCRIQAPVKGVLE